MKIGFIALSGVRVIDPELHRIGLNLPGFVERSKVIASLPSLGLLTLAGLTPPHHEIAYLDVPDADAPGLGRTLAQRFELVAVSSFTAMMPDAYRLADRLRSMGVIVVLGGLHVTLCPAEAQAHADAIVVGEGEPVWPQLLADVERGALRPRYHEPQAFNLAFAPMPRFDLLDPDRYNRITIQTSRGCPWNCEFCAASVRLNPRYRTKPVPKVIAELHRVKELWRAPFIEFADDNTFADRRHGHALMEALAPESIRWFTETDISVADDTALLRKMAAAGCAQVLIGLEDPGAGTNGIELRRNWKAARAGHYLESIRRIQEHGITVNGCFVLGLDSHTVESFNRTWEFIQKSELFEVQLTVLTPFPGTPLYARLQQENRLIDPTAWEKRTLFDIVFQPAHLSVAELHAGMVNLATKVYSQDFTDRRRRTFLRRKREREEEATMAASAR